MLGSVKMATEGGDMGNFELTQGAVAEMLKDGVVVEKPRVQVLAIKKIQSGNDAKKPDRYRLHLSDGVHKQPSAMLATQLNHLITENKIEKYGVLELEKYICNIVSERRIIIVLQATVIAKNAGGEIGKPQSIKDSKKDGGVSSSPKKAEETKAPTNNSYATHHNNNNNNDNNNNNSNNPYKQDVKPNVQRQVSGGGMNAAPRGASNDDCIPIDGLNPYQNRWTICARITNITERSYKNANGEGTIVNIDLLDSTGEIRCTAFNADAERLRPLLENGKMIKVKGGRIKPANKKYSRLNNDYEITFGKETEVMPAADTSEAPKISYTAVDFATLEAMNKDNAFVDVIAIVKESDPDTTTITSKKDGREILKREIELMDRSQIAVRCTLWGEQARQWQGHIGDVMCIRGAKLSDFNGCSMSIGGGSSFELNPDRQDAIEIREWFESEGKDASVKKIANTGAGSGMKSERIMLGQIKDEGKGMSTEETDWFETKATVTFVRKGENMTYKACKDCNKKMVELPGGELSCEKCNKTTRDFAWKIILGISCLDATGQAWFSNFTETGETILKRSISELGPLHQASKEGDESATKAWNDALESCYFSQWMFKCRAKARVYNDEQKPQISIVSATPVNPVTESRYLIDEIKKYLA